MKVLSTHRDPEYDSLEFHRFFRGEFHNIPVETIPPAAIMSSNQDDLRILTKRLIVYVVIEVNKKQFLLTGDFKKGFPSDLGSVPKRGRGVIDNDDIQFLIAFLFHDALYYLASKEREVLSFSVAQGLLRGIAIKSGAPKRKAFLAWLMCSMFSRGMWDKSGELDRCASQFVSITTEEM